MSNAYINQVLFGVSKEQVNAEYVDDLLPFMLTETKFNQMHSPSAVSCLDLENKVEPDQTNIDLHLFSFKTPALRAVMSEGCAANFASSMRNGVKPNPYGVLVSNHY